LSTSNHCRAIEVPISGLFWWSPEMTSIFQPFPRQAGILHRHLGGQRRARAGEIGVKAGLIGQHADLDHLVLGGGSTARRGQRQRGGQQ